MKKILSIFTAAALFTAAAFAQVDTATSEKAFKILESADDTLAYHGDYSATISLVIEKPGKPKEKARYFTGFPVYSPQIFLLKLCFHRA